MSNKNNIECPKIYGIYCLEYFWKKFDKQRQKKLNTNLYTAYKQYRNGKGNDTNWFKNEGSKVVVLCPDGHHGGDLRLVMIRDPRRNKPYGLICLKFPVYHNNGYTNAIENAEKAYDAFQAITFATEQELENFKTEVYNTDLRPLVVAGFYKEIFEESKAKEKILQAYDEAEKELNKIKQIEYTYSDAIQNLYEWCSTLTYTNCKEEEVKDFFKLLFNEITQKYGNDWPVHIKNILINNSYKNQQNTKFILDQLDTWEKQNKNLGYLPPHGDHEF